MAETTRIVRTVLLGAACCGSAVYKDRRVDKLVLDLEHKPRLALSKQRQAPLAVGEDPGNVIGKHLLGKAECHNREDGILTLGLLLPRPHGLGVEVYVSVVTSMLGGVAGHLQEELWITGLCVAAQPDLEHAPTQVLTHFSLLAILLVEPGGDTTAQLVHEEHHGMDGEQVWDRTCPQSPKIVSSRVPNTSLDGSNGFVAELQLLLHACRINVLVACKVLHDLEDILAKMGPKRNVGN